MIPKFLTVAIGKINVASRLILGGLVMFFVTVGGPIEDFDIIPVISHMPDFLCLFYFFTFIYLS